MPISSLVITVQCGREEAVLSALNTDTCLQIGAGTGVKLPVVLEASAAESEELLLHLEQMPGILRIDLLWTYFDEMAEPVRISR